MPTTREIALIMNVNKDYDRRIVAGIGRFARRAGNWSVYLEDDQPAKMPDLRSWRGHGIIADLDDPQVARSVARLDMPVVGVGGFARRETLDRHFGRVLPYVATDNDHIGALGAEHLLSCGLESFAYCGVPRTSATSWAAARGRAFAERLAAAGYSCAAYTGRHRTARRWEDLQRGLAAWIKVLPKPVGIMACDDPRARHVLEACRRLGLSVPDDVAILGVDNDPMMCEMSIPQLSSVEQDPELIGTRAAEFLEQQIRELKTVDTWTLVAPKGVVRRRSTEMVAVKNSLVARAMRYLNHQRLADVQVSRIAAHVGVSRTTLDNHFRRVLGRSVHDEIEQTRISTAKKLLAETDLPLRTVAERSGFRNDNYMGFVFRETVGVPPGAYRRAQGGSRT